MGTPLKFEFDFDEVFEGIKQGVIRELSETNFDEAKESAINQIKSEVKEKLAGYEQAELNAQKESVLSDEAYAEYLDTEEFTAVKEKMETLSVEELKTEAELAFAKCARKAKVQVSDNKENTTMKLFKTGNEDAEPTSKYGKIFSNK